MWTALHYQCPGEWARITPADVSGSGVGPGGVLGNPTLDLESASVNVAANAVTALLAGGGAPADSGDGDERHMVPVQPTRTMEAVVDDRGMVAELDARTMESVSFDRTMIASAAVRVMFPVEIDE